MTAFFGGIVFGALLIGCAFVLYLSGLRRSSKDPEDWTPEFHEPLPAVRTRLLIQERNFEF